jgi:hypothetical protein
MGGKGAERLETAPSMDNSVHDGTLGIKPFGHQSVENGGETPDDTQHSKRRYLDSQSIHGDSVSGGGGGGCRLDCCLQAPCRHRFYSAAACCFMEGGSSELAVAVLLPPLLLQAARRRAITELLFFASVGDMRRCQRIVRIWNLPVADPSCCDYDKRTPL